MNIQHDEKLIINTTREDALAMGVPEAVIAAAEERELLRQEAVVAQKYLNDTDWYVTRFAETGEAVPTDVTEKRAAAREAISKAQA